MTPVNSNTKSKNVRVYKTSPSPKGCTIKICADCKKELPISDYPIVKKTGRPAGSRCRACHNINARRYYCTEKSLERMRISSKKRYNEKGDDLRKKARENYRIVTKCGILKGRIPRLKRKYNLTPEEYMNILFKQNNTCAICHEKLPIDDFSQNGRKIHVDHCHVSNKVRGILCQHCNRGLGAFKDNIEYMENAIKYLYDSSK